MCYSTFVINVFIIESKNLIFSRPVGGVMHRMLSSGKQEVGFCASTRTTNIEGANVTLR